MTGTIIDMRASLFRLWREAWTAKRYDEATRIAEASRRIEATARAGRPDQRPEMPITLAEFFERTKRHWDALLSNPPSDTEPDTD